MESAAGARVYEPRAMVTSMRTVVGALVEIGRRQRLGLWPTADSPGRPGMQAEPGVAPSRPGDSADRPAASG